MICRKTSITHMLFVMTAVLALLISSGMGAVEAPTKQWNKTFGDNWYYGRSIKQTKDGGYIFTAYYIGPDMLEKGAIIKTDTNGNKQWTKLLENGEDYVQQTSDGGYIISGKKLIKMGADGNEQWKRSIDGYIHEVQQTSDGGYIFPGYEGLYAFLIKTDASGNEEWKKTFYTSDFWCSRYMGYGLSAQQTSDGGYIFAGCRKTNIYGATGPDAWLIKTDANGNEKWNMTYGGGGTDLAYSVMQTTDGGYIFAGVTTSDPAEDTDAWLVKTDINGNEQWRKTYGGKWIDIADCVQQTSDGGYIFAGWTQSYGSFNTNTWLTKTDANGNEEWNRTFGSNVFKVAPCVQQTLDGGYILISGSEGLIKLSPDKVNSLSKVTSLDIEKPAEKSAPGFEILGAMLSIVILFLLKRKRA